MIARPVDPLPIEEAVRRRAIKAALFGVFDPTLRIGRYVLEAAIGAGAMGVVIAARDERLDRRVAIKLLRPEILGPARLEREARALARMAHPNVVTVHEVGEHEGRTFLVMEHIEGVSLRVWLQEARPLAARLDVLRQAAQGLLAAHRLGLVHRDFKPENAIVGSDGRLRIVDFGLAAAPGELDTHGGSDTIVPPVEQGARITQTGQLLGTPAYMAPELLAGDPATPRSDQYALACVAWEVLWRRPTLAPASWRERVPAPPTNVRVPRRVRRVIARGLEPDPDARHADLSAFVDAFGSARGRARVLGVAAGALLVGATAAALAITSGEPRPLRTSDPPTSDAAPEPTLDAPAAASAGGIISVPEARDLAAGIVGPDGCRIVGFDRSRAVLQKQHAMLLELLRATDVEGAAQADLVRTLTALAETELALGRSAEACPRLRRVLDLSATDDRARCWTPLYCDDASTLPDRARCLGGDASVCMTVAIRHEYEFLEARGAVGSQQEGTDAAGRAERELDLLIEALGRACELDHADSCDQLSKYRAARQ